MNMEILPEIEDLIAGLRPRPANIVRNMARNRYDSPLTLKAMRCWPEWQMRKYHNCGPKSAREIYNALHPDMGLPGTPFSKPKLQLMAIDRVLQARKHLQAADKELQAALDNLNDVRKS